MHRSHPNIYIFENAYVNELLWKMVTMNKDLESLLSELKTVHEDLRLIPTEIIVVADWVRLKCRYGCDNYGKHLCCPPFSPTPQETRAILSEYRNAALARFEAKPDSKLTPKHAVKALSNSVVKMQKTVAELEKTAFLAGCYKAFGMNAMPCALCETCVIEEIQKKDQAVFELDGVKCKNKEIMRPSMEACGIDVFKTLQNAGYRPHVLKDCKETVELFGLILLD
jgi:predicted metal-binding protein